MRLAWRNLVHDRLRFAVTVVGIAFSLFLMTLQGGLFIGFRAAARTLVDATEADLWISARGVPCFDFASPLPARFEALARGVAGVTRVERVVMGWVTWRGPAGAPRGVGVVGAERRPGGRFPAPYADGGRAALLPDGVVIDRSSAANLGVDRAGVDVEIGGRRARVAGFVEGFGSFLGTPYVFASYRDTAAILKLGSEETHYLAVRLAPGSNPETVQRRLQARLPEADVRSRHEFGSRSGAYWMQETGAGGAMVLAGVLGLVVGAVIVSQTVYATTMENIEEFATLKAIGATRRQVRRVVLAQALAAGTTGCLLGTALAVPAASLARSQVVSWLATPPWLVATAVVVCMIMSAVASLSAVHAALGVDPARVFRA